MLSNTEIEVKILHVLSIYPIISPTMLQGGLGPQLKPRRWRPILATLIESGKVVEVSQVAQTPRGRFNNYTKLSLPKVVGVDAAVGEVMHVG